MLDNDFSLTGRRALDRFEKNTIVLSDNRGLFRKAEDGSWYGPLRHWYGMQPKPEHCEKRVSAIEASEYLGPYTIIAYPEDQGDVDVYYDLTSYPTNTLIMSAEKGLFLKDDNGDWCELLANCGDGCEQLTNCRDCEERVSAEEAEKMLAPYTLLAFGDEDEDDEVVL